MQLMVDGESSSKPSGLDAKRHTRQPCRLQRYARKIWLFIATPTVILATTRRLNGATPPPCELAGSLLT